MSETALSPHLAKMALNGLDLFRLARMGALTYSKPESPAPRRKRRNSTTSYHREYSRDRREQHKMSAAILKLASLGRHKGFTIDQLMPAFDRNRLRAMCNWMARNGQLKILQRGETGKYGAAGVPTIYCALEFAK